MGPTKTRNTKAWKEFESKHKNMEILTPAEWADIENMKSALMANPYISKILQSDSVWREISIWSSYEDSGIVCKVRPDIIVDGWIYDLKTSNAPHWRAFRHSIFQYGYHVSAPYYVDICKQIGLDIHGFRFIVVGNKRPYNTAVYELSRELYLEGQNAYKDGLRAFMDYLMSDDGWDGFSYGRDVFVIE